MIGDLSLYGIYFPAMALPLLLAFLALIPMRWLLGRAGVYRHVWHRSLFNLSLYLIVFYGMVVWTTGWLS